MAFLPVVAQGSIKEAPGDAAVRIDAAIPQERPVAACVFEQLRIDFGDEDLFRVVRGLRDDAAEGVGDEGAAPELEARRLSGTSSSRMPLCWTSPCSWPTRLTAPTKTPLAMACARCMVCQALYWASPNSAFSLGCQPMAVG